MVPKVNIRKDKLNLQKILKKSRYQKDLFRVIKERKHVKYSIIKLA